MNGRNFLKKSPNRVEVFEGKVEWVEDVIDIMTDKNEYLQDILYHMYDKKKVRITIELLESEQERTEVYEGKVKWTENVTDIMTDKNEYLQDILYHNYDGKKVRITIELLEYEEE